MHTLANFLRSMSTRRALKQENEKLRKERDEAVDVLNRAAEVLPEIKSLAA